MEVWLIMIAAGGVTFGIRLSFIAFIGNRDISPRVRSVLRFVPPSVLSAIIFQEMLIRNGALDLSPGNPRLAAGLAAGLVAWRTKNVLLTITAGMAVLLLFEYLLAR
jgi:branched-subunit amino acid transport protein